MAINGWRPAMRNVQVRINVRDDVGRMGSSCAKVGRGCGSNAAWRSKGRTNGSGMYAALLLTVWVYDKAAVEKSGFMWTSGRAWSRDRYGHG